MTELHLTLDGPDRWREGKEIPRKVVSVPHSGTRFLKRLLNCDGRHTYFGHIDGFLRNTVVVCPLRRPEDVWASWIKRAGSSEGRDLNSFQECWRLLGKIGGRTAIHYIPLDRPEREEELLKVAKRIKEDLSPDWIPVGRYREPQEEVDHIPRINWEAIYELPMVKRFYGDFRVN